MKSGGRDALDGKNVPLVESRDLMQSPNDHFVPRS